MGVHRYIQKGELATVSREALIVNNFSVSPTAVDESPLLPPPYLSSFLRNTRPPRLIWGEGKRGTRVGGMESVYVQPRGSAGISRLVWSFFLLFLISPFSCELLSSLII